MSTRLYESQKGLCEDRSLIFSTKHFAPDLRLAKYYSQHIRSMVTTNLSNGERPQGFSPPLIWCNTYYTQPFCWPYRTLFTCNFQKAFRNLVIFFFITFTTWSYFTSSNDCVFLLAPATCLIHVFLRFTAKWIAWHYLQWLSSPQG